MTLLKVLIVLSALLVASSYGHSQRVGGRGRAPRKWTTAGRDRTSMHSDRLARINHHVPEEKYRLDEVPCRGAIMPPENEVYHYYAPVRYSRSYHCYASMLQHAFIDKEEDGTYDLRSPGKDHNYPPQRLSYYRITCPGHQIMFSVMYKFHLQDKMRISNNQKKCVDYVKITDLSDTSKTEEFCGMQTLYHALSTEIYTDDVLVTFRSSNQNNHYPGFALHAKCYKSSQIMGNCLKVDNSEYAAEQTIDKWTRKIVPKYALSELRAFLDGREQGGDVWIMSDEEAVWNADMLSLAVLSEHSCAAEYRRAGKAVLELFPKWMVKKERESFKKDAVFNT